MNVPFHILEEMVWDPRNAASLIPISPVTISPGTRRHSELDVAFHRDEDDPRINPMGAKSIAELALVGNAPAQRPNAVSQASASESATCRSPDKLL